MNVSAVWPASKPSSWSTSHFSLGSNARFTLFFAKIMRDWTLLAESYGKRFKHLSFDPFHFFKRRSQKYVDLSIDKIVRALCVHYSDI